MKTEIYKNTYGIFECFINDKHITNHIKQNKIFHPTIYTWIKDYMSGSLLDIGANIGMYSVIISKEYPSATVHAIEAHPEIYKVLVNNKKLNNLSNLTTYNFAALDDNRECFFDRLRDTPNFNTGDMRISYRRLPFSVQGLRCDKQIDTNINFSIIKIDAQGSDYQALLGCESIIDKNRPAIIIEWEQDMVTNGLTIEDVSKYLKGFNYIIQDTYMRDFLFIHQK